MMIAIRKPIRLILLLALLLSPEKTQAHSGLPFVILRDKQFSPYTISVWADPDVGAGLFIIEGTVDPALRPVELKVYLRIRRSDGSPARSDGVTYTASEQRRTESGAERFIVRLPFEVEGYWQVDLTLDSAGGPVTIRFPVEATPPEARSLELFLVFIPFGIIVIFWWVTIRRAPAAPGNVQSSTSKG